MEPRPWRRWSPRGQARGCERSAGRRRVGRVCRAFRRGLHPPTHRNRPAQDSPASVRASSPSQELRPRGTVRARDLSPEFGPTRLRTRSTSERVRQPGASAPRGRTSTPLQPGRPGTDEEVVSQAARGGHQRSRRMAGSTPRSTGRARRARSTRTPAGTRANSPRGNGSPARGVGGIEGRPTAPPTAGRSFRGGAVDDEARQSEAAQRQASIAHSLEPKMRVHPFSSRKCSGGRVVTSLRSPSPGPGRPADPVRLVEPDGLPIRTSGEV